MNHFWPVLLSFFLPAIAFAQQEAPPTPHETPWGGLILFGALLAGGCIYAWMIWFRKKDKKED